MGLHTLDDIKGTRIDADVAIVGAGAAGITMAMKLKDSGLEVALLEGGLLDNPGALASCYDGETSATGYPLMSTRLRFFGGTTNHWGGWCARLFPIDLEARDNHVMVFLSDDHECDWERLTRHLFSASSCGLCGKATVDAILQSHPPIGQRPEFDPVVIQSAPDTMRGAQSNFDSTGGIHASGIFSHDGKLLILREDIGRHNALDKVIGEGLIKGIDFTQCFLLVSGRISFELMQKAIAARLPLVAGISAPSSLAVSFAKTSNQTLIGFLRPPHMNYYT